MARSNLKPVSVAGIEFDALLDEQKTLAATIPVYPVEDGFPVSDTIILDPISVSMTLYVSNTPVTWLYRHGTSNGRVNSICNRMEELWLSKKLVKIVTTDTVYTNMGITSISIKHSKELGYAREISLSAQKIRVTSRKTVSVPSYILRAGETMANAGMASTSTESSSSGAGGSGGGAYASASASGSASGSGSSGGSSGSSAKKNQSILYGAAKGLGFI